MLDVLRYRPDKGTQAVIILFDELQVDALGVVPQTISPGAVLGEGMNVGIVPEAGDLIVVGPQNINALIGTGGAADVK